MRGVPAGGAGPVKRFAIVALVLMVVAGAAVLTAAGGEEEVGATYEVVFDNAFGLTRAVT